MALAELSAVSAWRSRGMRPFSSRNPARWHKPTNVPAVSNRSTITKVKMITTMPTSIASTMSSLRKVGARLGGVSTTAWGMGASPNSMPATVTARIAIMIEPGTRKW